jgi:hypothetical protein
MAIALPGARSWFLDMRAVAYLGESPAGCGREILSIRPGVIRWRWRSNSLICCGRPGLSKVVWPPDINRKPNVVTRWTRFISTAG